MTRILFHEEGPFDNIITRPHMALKLWQSWDGDNSERHLCTV